MSSAEVAGALTGVTDDAVDWDMEENSGESWTPSPHGTQTSKNATRFATEAAPDVSS